MEIEIVPEPDEQTRAVILAALAEDESDGEPRSAWADLLLPGRDGDPES